jgi:thiol-disulfide isomerase/thioredoxin
VDAATASAPASSPEDRAAAAKSAAMKGLNKEFASAEEFEHAAETALKAGVAQQVVDEVRLLVNIKLRNVDGLPAIVAGWEKKMDTWKESDSVVFHKKSDLEGVLFFARALIADKENKDQDFEHAVKEGFWADPELGEILADLVKTRRAKQHMASIVLPMDLQIESATGTKTSLAELAKGQKALLLDFWASWCGPCMANMDELVKRAHDLSPQHVAVVGVNTQADEDGGPTEAKKQAAQEKKKRKIDFAWLVEPADRPLSKSLNIDSIPRAVLVTPDGKVLYDGHPADPELLVALKKLEVTLAARTKPAS